MQIISTMVLYNYKVPVIIKKKKIHILSWSITGKPSKYFPGLMNKIQGLSRTFQNRKKNPGLFQDVATLDIISYFLSRLDLKFRLTDKPSFSAYTVCTFISGSTFIHAPASKFLHIFFVLSNDAKLACDDKQRWSPGGHILKSMALASKVKSLKIGLSSARGQQYFLNC